MELFDTDLSRVRLVFKNCELGVTGGMPLFRILPEQIRTGMDGICSITAARHVTVTFGLEHLEEGFALLLDKQGHLQKVPPELFAAPGKLRLTLPDDAQDPGWEIPRASLAGDTFYGILPGAGHRLLLEFVIAPAAPGGACLRRALSGKN